MYTSSTAKEDCMNANCLVYIHTHFFVDKIRSDWIRLLGSQRYPNKQYSAIHLIVSLQEMRGILAIQNLIFPQCKLGLLFSQSIEVGKNH